MATSVRHELAGCEGFRLESPQGLAGWIEETWLGADGVFVGSGIFKSGDPLPRAKAIVEATTHFNDAEIIARVSRGLGDAMSGLSTASLAPEELLETRGW